MEEYSRKKRRVILDEPLVNDTEEKPIIKPIACEEEPLCYSPSMTKTFFATRETKLLMGTKPSAKSIALPVGEKVSCVGFYTPVNGKIFAFVKSAVGEGFIDTSTVE